MFRFSEYVEFIKNIHNKDGEIDGVFAVDNIICAVCKVAERLNIDIPERLKLVGYDGTEISLMPSKSITTIEQDIKKIAETAVDTLISMIDKTTDFEQDTHFKIPVKLVRRETSL